MSAKEIVTTRATLAALSERARAGEGWRELGAEVGLQARTLRDRCVRAGLYAPSAVPYWHTTEAEARIGEHVATVWRCEDGWMWNVDGKSGTSTTIRAAKVAAERAVRGR